MIQVFWTEHAVCTVQRAKLILVRIKPNFYFHPPPSKFGYCESRMQGRFTCCCNNTSLHINNIPSDMPNRKSLKIKDSLEKRQNNMVHRNNDELHFSADLPALMQTSRSPGLSSEETHIWLTTVLSLLAFKSILLATTTTPTAATRS